MAGTATEPTAEKPVRNLPASIHELARFDPGEPLKKSAGIGTSTYMNAAEGGEEGGRCSQRGVSAGQAGSTLPTP